MERYLETYKSKHGRPYEVEILVEWDYDADYGADRDGNRGHESWSADESEIQSIYSEYSCQEIPIDSIPLKLLNKIEADVIDNIDL